MDMTNSVIINLVFIGCTTYVLLLLWEKGWRHIGLLVLFFSFIGCRIRHYIKKRQLTHE
jgi:hypothetical protein